MQHFLNLEKCSCGAYRYLAVREHKKSFEIYMIHHKHFSSGQDTRKYRKLASIPKFKINLHDERVDQQQRDRTVKLSYEETAVLRSLLRQIEAGKNVASVRELEDDPSDIDAEFLEELIPAVQPDSVDP